MSSMDIAWLIASTAVTIITAIGCLTFLRYERQR